MEKENKTILHKSINLLSLFDGYGGSILSLQRALEETDLPFTINNFISAEIEKNALTVLNHHWTDHEYVNYQQLGDITKISIDDITVAPTIICYGSPCLELSAISPNRGLQLTGEHSSLYFTATKLIAEIKAKFPENKICIIAENVASLKNDSKLKMISELEKVTGEKIYCTKIDSAVHAAVHRRRIYLTNFEVHQPEPVECYLQDLLFNGFTDREKGNVILSSNITKLNGLCNRYLKMNIGNAVFKDERFAKLPNEEKCRLYPQILAASGYNGKGRFGQHEFPNGCYRTLSNPEIIRAHQIPEGYLINEDLKLSATAIQRLIGEGFVIKTVTEIMKDFLNDFKYHES